MVRPASLQRSHGYGSRLMAPLVRKGQPVTRPEEPLDVPVMGAVRCSHPIQRRLVASRAACGGSRVRPIVPCGECICRGCRHRMRRDGVCSGVASSPGVPAHITRPCSERR
jgi:hypothetical protein